MRIQLLPFRNPGLSGMTLDVATKKAIAKKSMKVISDQMMSQSNTICQKIESLHMPEKKEIAY